MATEKIADLKVKIEKLKEAEFKLRSEIDDGKAELEQLNTSIQRGEIELELINDAFNLKFGDVSASEKNTMLRSMEQLNQIDILEAELALESEKARQAQIEIERLSGIAPKAPVQEIDIFAFENQEKELAESLKSQKIRNSKREKNIRLTDSKIASILVELEEIDKKVAIRQQKDQEIEVQLKEAENVRSEINSWSDNYKTNNQVVHEIQEKLEEANKEIEEINSLVEENQDFFKSEIQESQQLQDLLKYINESNLPWEQNKIDHEGFEKRSTKFRANLTDLLQQITSLIDVIKAEME